MHKYKYSVCTYTLQYRVQYLQTCLWMETILHPRPALGFNHDIMTAGWTDRIGDRMIDVVD